MPTHSREDLLDAAVVVAREQGLSQLSFGRVANQADTNDRTVVYYFPTKQDLVASVLSVLSAELLALLAEVGSRPFADHRELFQACWNVLGRPAADPLMGLVFQACGLALAGVAPYPEVVRSLFAGWLTWAETRLGGPPRRRRGEAAAALAQIDGLLLVRQLLGGEAAEQAARTLRRP